MFHVKRGRINVIVAGRKLTKVTAPGDYVFLPAAQVWINNEISPAGSVMSTGPASTTNSKPRARALLAGIDESRAGVLRDCFRQFGIETLLLPRDEAIERLNHQKFEALVAPLDDEAPPLLEAVRNSRSNSRLVLYGVAREVQQALRFSRYGVNAIIDDPVDRQRTLKVVRATHLLVLHELRRYVRIPLITTVAFKGDAGEQTATSREISGGGISLHLKYLPTLEERVQLSFTLRNAGYVEIAGSVCWLAPKEKLAGVRFDPAAESRQLVKSWIEQYLEM
jgi:hypothetical protein